MTSASPLLSAEESRLAVRPLRGWSEADQSLLAGAAQAMLEQWNGAWGLAAPDGAAVAVRACPIEDTVWEGVSWSLLDEAGVAAGIRWSLWGGAPGVSLVPAAARRHRPALGALHVALLREAPVASSGEPSLADQLIRAAWADWIKRLAGLLPAGTRAAPDTAGVAEAATLLRQPWSGALLIDIPWCDRHLALLLTAQHVAAFLARQIGRTDPASVVRKTSTPLVPLFQVVKDEGVALRVELAEMAIDLGTLAGLRSGDVLHTSHRLDTPLLLTGEGQAERVTQCVGHLGRQDEWRAIELLPHAALSGHGAAT